jgi:hypothetical protein
MADMNFAIDVNLHGDINQNPTHAVAAMRELMQRTRRIRRGWLDRLRGYDRLYETELTDGLRTAYGRGSNPQASQKSAQRNWELGVGGGLGR